MLYRNGENLKLGLLDYLSHKSKITIFCPYIKASKLREIIDDCNMKCEQMVVRWEPRDLASGASDIEIYEICKEYGITLYMNSRIHLKLFTNDYEDAFLGSANLSERAYSDDINNCNYEVNVRLDRLNVDDKLYLEKIIQSSILVDDFLYQNIKAQISENSTINEKDSFDLPNSSTNESDFFINKLPMTESPELLWQFYSEQLNLTNLEENCYVHDLVLYKIEPGIEFENIFYEILAERFFGLTFIKTFLLEVDEAKRTDKYSNIRNGLQFGAVRKWFSEKTTTVPSPRPFKLTRNVQILYKWIEKLSNGEYEVSVPGRHSQVITKRN
jgi:hypothetical protein